VRFVERDAPAARARAHVGYLVDAHPRTVGAGQDRVKGARCGPVLQVDVLAVPGGEVTRSARVGRVVRHERDRPLGCEGRPGGAVGERGDVEDAVFGDAGDRARSASAGIRAGVAEDHLVVEVLREADRTSTGGTSACR